MSVTGFMRVPKLAPDYKLLLFFGSPRAGSTLLGQILNNHPNALVANEYRLLQKIVREGRDLEKQLRKLRQTAWRHYKSGLKKDRYFSDKLSKFQPRWIEFDRSQKKGDIKLLGDKKAGGNTTIFLEQPTRTENFIKEHTPYLLQIVRHPVDAALSSAKAFDLEFRHALKDQILRTTEAYRLLQEHKALSYVLYYEDLVRQPTEELGKLIGFLGLCVDDEWIETVSISIDKGAVLECVHNPEQLALARDLIERYNAQDIFSRYDGLA